MSDSWLWMTAADLGRGIEAGAIDARELTEVYLAAIDSHPEAAGIYARTTPDRARAEAEAAAGRARAGLRRGPLDGVPVELEGPLRHRRHRHRGRLGAARAAASRSATPPCSPPPPAPASSASARPT